MLYPMPIPASVECEIRDIHYKAFVEKTKVSLYSKEEQQNVLYACE